MTEEEIKQYLKNNLKLSLKYDGDNYYLVLSIKGEPISKVSLGEGY
jgi:hypothetical protein